MTLNAMFRHPDLYKTGIAIAFVSDQRLYDTIYQERFMARPQDNPEGYDYLRFGRAGFDLLCVRSTDSSVHSSR